jgi:hypothetical protein
MHLQAATQLEYLNLHGLKDFPEVQTSDWAAFLQGLQGVELGGELAVLQHHVSQSGGLQGCLE